MPRHMLEEYKKIILETQDRVLEDGEAEIEALNLLDGVGWLVQRKADEIERKKEEKDRESLHRILTNGFKEPKLGPVDSEFFG